MEREELLVTLCNMTPPRGPHLCVPHAFLLRALAVYCTMEASVRALLGAQPANTFVARLVASPMRRV